jgi:hypothetical protein
MSLSAILLGLINIGIVVLILVLIGFIIVWILSLADFPVPAMVQKIYMGIVALVALYMIVALLFGLGTWRIIHLGKGVDRGGDRQRKARATLIRTAPRISRPRSTLESRAPHIFGSSRATHARK